MGDRSKGWPARVASCASSSITRSPTVSASDDARGGRRAPQDGVDTRHQFGERERLRHVVVAAHGEARDGVVRLVAGREEDDRHVVAARAQLAGHGEAVHVRHHHVEHDRGAGGGLGDGGERLRSRGGRADLEAREPQRRREEVPQVRLVVDHEDAIADMPAASSVMAQVWRSTWEFPGRRRRTVAPPECPRRHCEHAGANRRRCDGCRNEQARLSCPRAK